MIATPLQNLRSPFGTLPTNRRAKRIAAAKPVGCQTQPQMWIAGRTRREAKRVQSIEHAKYGLATSRPSGLPVMPTIRELAAQPATEASVRGGYL